MSSTTTDFKHSVEIAVPGYPDQSSFLPIQALNTSGSANVILLFLEQNSNYLGPVSDPCFFSEVPYLYRYDEQSPPTTFYTRPGRDATLGNEVTVLGCLEATELCNPNHPSGNTCVAFNGLVNADIFRRKLGFSARQTATLNRTIEWMVFSTVSYMAGNLGAPSMLAYKGFVGTLLQALPKNQWVLEIQNWFATALTFLQLSTAQYAIGYRKC